MRAEGGADASHYQTISHWMCCSVVSCGFLSEKPTWLLLFGYSFDNINFELVLLWIVLRIGKDSKQGCGNESEMALTGEVVN